MKSGNKLIGVGLLTAVSASLCCITPVLALMAGTSGLASTFSWLDPFRPYLISLTILVLAFAWYQKLKPQKIIDCNCETKETTPFIHSKIFLGIITIFAGLMLAFPAYATIFYRPLEKQTIVTAPANIRIAEFKISGMTCSSCEDHVHHEVNKLAGIIETNVSYENGNAIIEFDKTQTDIKEIEKAIVKTGYSVIDEKEIK